ncbi:hydrogenase [Pararhodospirillum oryzae]|uniref:Hydrogenase n=1 Tax=Pararhodospirillum oryzae TaxID=478448 RepID=A0A512H4H5_9PROT|nr:hydrogenase [Pararhodospirillum oryzae]
MFHWSLVALLILLYITGENIDSLGEIHMFLGRVTVALVLARVIWGFVGSETSRFANFVKPPQEILAYIKSVRSGEHWTGLGHNPAGAVMMLGLLALMLLQGFTGLFSYDDGAIVGGPFHDMVSEDTAKIFTGLHETIFNLAVLLALVHIAAALFYKFVKKDDLIHPLVTGVRPTLPGAVEPKFASPVLAVGLFVGCLVVIFLMTGV